MKNTSIYILLFCVGLISSCKKEKLSSDYSYLYGKWIWNNTIHEYQDHETTFRVAVSDNSTYSIEIEEKRITFYKENKKECRKKIRSITVVHGTTDSSAVQFSIGFNKNEGILLYYYPLKKSITLYGYPYNYVNSGYIRIDSDGSGLFENYYLRE